MNAGEYMHEYSTVFNGAYRKNDKNPRKSYWAMTFKRGPAVLEENKPKVLEMIKTVHEKVGVKFAEEYAAPASTDTGGADYPTEDINPDDIPF
jgi:hypothetical protein